MFFGTEHSPVVQHGLLPLAIFLARVTDVSMGTLRVIMLARGMRLVAPVLGFIEIMIWLLAIGQIMQNLHNWACFFAYALGFAAGNYTGMVIESRLAMGLSMVRVVAPAGAGRLKRFLRRAGFRTTSVEATGNQGPVEIIFTVIRRRYLRRIERVILRYNPRAFYTIEDVRFASEQGLAGWREPRRLRLSRRLIPRRKGK